MMTRFKLLLFAITSMSLCYISGQAQNAPPAISPAWLENDREVTKGFDDVVHMNMPYGVAEVTIPFHDFMTNGMDLGVTMSYQTSGILVDQFSSSLGLGWNLNIGGHIVRQVRGTYDDLCIPTAGAWFFPALWGYWSSSPTDKESDIFYVNIAGRNLKLIFGKNGEFITIPKSNIKVQRLVNGNVLSVGNTITSPTESSDLKFIITDERGNQFYFQSEYVNRVYEEKTVLGNTGSRQYHTVDQWTLEKVIPYCGEPIYYEYETIGEIHHVFSKQQMLLYHSTSSELREDNVAEKRYHIKKIKKIKYTNNVDVEFEYDNTYTRMDLPGEKRLSKIIVKERSCPSGILCNYITYNFNQAYILSETANAHTYYWGYEGMLPLLNSELSITYQGSSYAYTRLRMKLKSIDISGLNNISSKLYYQFVYDAVPLPERLSGGRDWAGYANGTVPAQYNGADLLTAPVTVSNNTFGCNRSASSLDHMEASSLRKIINSAGGQVEFAYHTSTMGRGLKIASVLYYDGYNHENDIRKSYSRITDGPIVNEGFHQYEFITGLCTGDISWNATHNTAILLNQNLNGLNCPYSTVTEFINDNGVTWDQRTTYKFSNELASPSHGIPDNLLGNSYSNGTSFQSRPFSNKQYIRDWAMSLPLSKEVYDNNNKKISKTSYLYAVTTEQINNSNFACEGALLKKASCFNYDSYTDQYYPFTGSALLTQIKEEIYTDDNNSISTIKELFYDTHNNLRLEGGTSSTSDMNYKYYYYNYNFNNAPGAGIAKLNQDGIERLIYTEERLQDYVIKRNFQGLGVLNNRVLPVTVYSLSSALPVYSGTTYSPLPSSDMDFAHLGYNAIGAHKKRMDLSKYDDVGNLLEKIEQPSGRCSAQIWDTDTKKLLAVALNAEHKEIGYCGFESNYVGADQYSKGNFNFPLGGITTNPQYVLFGRCSYHLSGTNNYSMWTTGTLNTSDPNKKYILSYWAYGNNAAVYANDGGTGSLNFSVVASYGDWKLYRSAPFHPASTGIGVWGDAYIDDIRLYPEVSQMKTYTYKPLCGKSVEVDWNDRMTMYEYDDFGNVSIVRDNKGNILSKTIDKSQVYE